MRTDKIKEHLLKEQELSETIRKSQRHLKKLENDRWRIISEETMPGLPDLFYNLLPLLQNYNEVEDRYAMVLPSSYLSELWNTMISFQDHIWSDDLCLPGKKLRYKTQNFWGFDVTLSFSETGCRKQLEKIQLGIDIIHPECRFFMRESFSLLFDDLAEEDREIACKICEYIQIKSREI